MLLLVCACGLRVSSKQHELGSSASCPSLGETALSAGVDVHTPIAELRCILLAARESTASSSLASIASRAAFHLADASTDQQTRHELASEGMHLARAALADGATDEAALHYYLALNLGLAVENDMLKAVANMRTLQSHLEKALQAAPEQDASGPRRVLGLFLLRAPPWPKGPGDGDRALELLATAAKKHPEHPLNLIFYARALHEVEQDAQGALELLERCRTLLLNERWRETGRRWWGEFDYVARSLGARLLTDASPLKTSCRPGDCRRGVPAGSPGRGLAARR